MSSKQVLGTRLRAERQARGWDVPEMARKLRLAAHGDPHLPDLRDLRRMIRGWERGDHALSERYRLLYAAAFAVPPDELSERLEEAGNGVLGPLPGAPSDSERADAQLLISGRLDLMQVERLRRGLDEAMSEHAMAPASLDDWERTVMRHGEATRERPAAVMLADLSADLFDLRRALVRCRSSSALRRLTRVTAQMAGLMCLTLIKLGDRAAFRRWARTARVAAQEAGDPLTYAWVRAQEAYGYYYSGELTEAIDVAQHAQALGGSRQSVGAVLAAALEARAQAALGPGLGRETKRALRHAEAILSDLDAPAVMASAFGYNEAQLRFHAGSAYTHLHDTAAAAREQERALQLYPASDFLDRALTQLDQAYCLAYDGDATEAVARATQTLTGLTALQRQGIITSRAREIMAALPARQRALPPVREFRELLADLHAMTEES